MQSDLKTDRAVIPRWRPLPAIETRDLESIPRFANEAHVHVAEDLASHLDIWRSEKGLAAAIDIFDAAVLTQDTHLLAEAIKLLSEHKDRLPPRMADAMRLALKKKDDPIQKRRIIASWESNPNYVVNTLRVYKVRLREYPRDALAHVEIARLYSIIGQTREAERHLQVARGIAPNDRYILRATLRFYDFYGDLLEGLSILRKSERLQYDPWIQSAEIAATGLLGKASRVRKNPELKLDEFGAVVRNQTELAMALATRDLSSGSNERKIFQMVRRALPQSTENGVAQAVWLSDHSSRSFEDRFPKATLNEEANEANVQLAIDRKDFATAASHAELWLEDQPFSQDALIKYLNLRAVHVGPDKDSVKWARRALLMYHDDWHVMNAALLLLVEAREFRDAERAFVQLRRHAPKNEGQAFVQAADGFLSFGKGELAKGREAYAKALCIAKERRSQSLIIDAAMFWLRCEASNSLVTQTYIDELDAKFSASLKRLPKTERNFLEGIWFSIKKEVSDRAKVDEKPPQEILESVKEIDLTLDSELLRKSPLLV